MSVSPVAFDESVAVPDLNYLNDLLINRMKVKRQPVAITYCRPEEGPPADYEAVQIVACGIVRAAEGGRRIYVDQSNHDCWVGQYHLGWLPQADGYITDGRYLTDAQAFYTQEAAACNKRQSYTLAAGTLSALAAAPLNAVPAGVRVDAVICVVDPQRAMQIAGAASVREGNFPLGELGASACSSIFSAPLLTGNSVFAIGDGGGRMHNRLDVSEMFVTIPRNHLRYVVELIENFRIDPQKMREVIMPSYAAKAQARQEE